MSATKILWGQVLLVATIVLVFLWAATEWTAWQLDFPGTARAAMVRIPRLAFYRPLAFWWWFAYDAYAHDIFVDGGFIAASGGIAAITVSVWPAREVKRIKTYGSARWSDKRDIRRSGLFRLDGVLLGRWRGEYLRSLPLTLALGVSFSGCADRGRSLHSLGTRPASGPRDAASEFRQCIICPTEKVDAQAGSCADTRVLYRLSVHGASKSPGIGGVFGRTSLLLTNERSHTGRVAERAGFEPRLAPSGSLEAKPSGPTYF